MMVLGIVLVATGMIVKYIFIILDSRSMLKDLGYDASWSEFWSASKWKVRDLIWITLLWTGLILVLISLKK